MPIKSHPYLRSASFKPDAAIDRTQFPYSLAAVQQIAALKFDREVTFLVGENGCGKSTLLEGIAVAWGFNAEGGSSNFRFSTRASHSDLHTKLRLVRSATRPKDGFFLRAESYFNLATNIEELDREGCGPPLINSYGGHSLHEQSHGESFLALLLHRFKGKGLYILDEPEAALSPSRQIAVLLRMHELVENDSQFVIATHSPILMAYPGARIYALDAKGVRSTRYEETDHYALTKRFLADPNRMFEEMLRAPRPEDDDASG